MKSLMLTYWEGGGAPDAGARTQTFAATTAEDLRARALAWLDAHLSPGRPAVPLSDVPVAIWPDLEEWEDVTDATA